MRLAGALVLILVLVPAAAAGSPARTGYPNSMGVIGDSWETGFATNSALPPADVAANNWATGTSPVVDSFYSRILAANPRIKGNVYNVAHDGDASADFESQAERLPAHLDFVLEALGGNSFCPALKLSFFRGDMAAGMKALSRAEPDARILMIGIGGVEPFWDAGGTGSADVREQLTDPRGVGACDPKFDASGVPAPAQVTLLHQQEDVYNGVLESICAQYVHCRWDGPGFDGIDLQLSDISPLDAGHPSPSGAAKMAASIWAGNFDFTDTSAPVSKAHRSGSRVTLTATDAQGVSGIEYRLTASGPWTRYAKPLTLKKGKTLTWRAVDVNGNVEASHSLKG
ncbi:MAG TPA: hypothetical protein VHD91_01575 [Gaiellaceae bacterium]|nr:hypothetical protein [Gaiellaceae bacterium]